MRLELDKLDTILSNLVTDCILNFPGSLFCACLGWTGELTLAPCGNGVLEAGVPAAFFWKKFSRHVTMIVDRIFIDPKFGKPRVQLTDNHDATIQLIVDAVDVYLVQEPQPVPTLKTSDIFKEDGASFVFYVLSGTPSHSFHYVSFFQNKELFFSRYQVLVGQSST